MSFVSERTDFEPESPLFALILSNTEVSCIPGVSGAGENPESSFFVPSLDAELIINGKLSGDLTPNTPTGCPTPAAITRSMMDLTGRRPLMIASGLRPEVIVPHMQLGEDAGGVPHGKEDAVPHARLLFEKGKWIGEFLSRSHDMLVLGECIPGGTTTALCVLRALGYQAKVSSCLVENPVVKKEQIAAAAVEKVKARGLTDEDPLAVVSAVGDPMIPVAAGVAAGFRGKLFLAGGTQMLAVCAVIRALGLPVPDVVTTSYVYNDASASFKETAAAIGADTYYVDPGFETLGHAGIARYAQGEIKEGSGAGGSMFLASVMGYAPEDIRASIYEHICRYAK